MNFFIMHNNEMWRNRFLTISHASLTTKETLILMVDVKTVRITQIK